jgi:hypothetical protein
MNKKTLKEVSTQFEGKNGNYVDDSICNKASVQYLLDKLIHDISNVSCYLSDNSGSDFHYGVSSAESNKILRPVLEKESMTSIFSPSYIKPSEDENSYCESRDIQPYLHQNSSFKKSIINSFLANDSIEPRDISVSHVESFEGDSYVNVKSARNSILRRCSKNQFPVIRELISMETSLSEDTLKKFNARNRKKRDLNISAINAHEKEILASNDEIQNLQSFENELERICNENKENENSDSNAGCDWSLNEIKEITQVLNQLSKRKKNLHPETKTNPKAKKQQSKTPQRQSCQNIAVKIEENAETQRLKEELSSLNLNEEIQKLVSTSKNINFVREVTTCERKARNCNKKSSHILNVRPIGNENTTKTDSNPTFFSRKSQTRSSKCSQKNKRQEKEESGKDLKCKKVDHSNKENESKSSTVCSSIPRSEARSPTCFSKSQRSSSIRGSRVIYQNNNKDKHIKKREKENLHINQNQNQNQTKSKNCRNITQNNKLKLSKKMVNSSIDNKRDKNTNQNPNLNLNLSTNTEAQEAREARELKSKKKGGNIFPTQRSIHSSSQIRNTECSILSSKESQYEYFNEVINTGILDFLNKRTSLTTISSSLTPLKPPSSITHPLPCSEQLNISSISTNSQQTKPTPTHQFPTNNKNKEKEKEGEPPLKPVSSKGIKAVKAINNYNFFLGEAHTHALPNTDRPPISQYNEIIPHLQYILGPHLQFSNAIIPNDKEFETHRNSNYAYPQYPSHSHSHSQYKYPPSSQLTSQCASQFNSQLNSAVQSPASSQYKPNSAQYNLPLPNSNVLSPNSDQISIHIQNQINPQTSFNHQDRIKSPERNSFSANSQITKLQFDNIRICDSQGASFRDQNCAASNCGDNNNTNNETEESALSGTGRDQKCELIDLSLINTYGVISSPKKSGAPSEGRSRINEVYSLSRSPSQLQTHPPILLKSSRKPFEHLISNEKASAIWKSCHKRSSTDFQISNTNLMNDEQAEEEKKDELETERICIYPQFNSPLQKTLLAQSPEEAVFSNSQSNVVEIEDWEDICYKAEMQGCSVGKKKISKCLGDSEVGRIDIVEDDDYQMEEVCDSPTPEHTNLQIKHIPDMAIITGKLSILNCQCQTSPLAAPSNKQKSAISNLNPNKRSIPNLKNLKVERKKRKNGHAQLPQFGLDSNPNSTNRHNINCNLKCLFF